MSSSESVVVALYTRLLESWNRRDGAGFAELFTADGSCVGFDGSQMDGPAKIATELGNIFTHHPTATYVARVRAVTSLGPSATLLRAVAGMVPRGGDQLTPAVNAIQTLVATHGRDGADARIALFQNTPAAFHGRPELAEQLTAELTEVLRSGRIVER
jgi:uncharacterized protein (TIGR02246 family)